MALLANCRNDKHEIQFSKLETAMKNNGGHNDLRWYPRKLQA